MSKRILLLGTHGQSNIGDELLLATFLRELGPEHRYEINSYDPVATATSLDPNYDVDVFDTATTRIGLIGRIRRADIVFFAGGSIVKELTPATGRRRCSVLLMVLALMTVARWFARTPVLMSNIGVGPVETRRGRLLATLILRQATIISVRDHASWTTCRQLGVRDDRLVELPDAVFVNGPEVFSTARGVPSPAGGPLRLALSLNHDVENEAVWQVFLGLLGTALRQVHERVGLEILALPMQSAYKEDHDLAVIEEFVAEHGLTCVVEPVIDHDDAARVIARADVVLAERLHAVVLSTILGTPVVPLPYSIKVSELAEGLGLADVSFPVDDRLDPAALADAICSLTARPEEGDRLRAVAAARQSELTSYGCAVRQWIASPTSDRAASDLVSATR